MRFFEFAIALIAIVLSYSAFMTLIGARRRRADSQESQAQADQLADRERLENLEERVAVLERVITDKKSSLHRQFSDLE